MRVQVGFWATLQFLGDAIVHFTVRILRVKLVKYAIERGGGIFVFIGQQPFVKELS
jgi:hypothetical protein